MRSRGWGWGGEVEGLYWQETLLTRQLRMSHPVHSGKDFTPHALLHLLVSFNYMVSHSQNRVWIPQVFSDVLSWTWTIVRTGRMFSLTSTSIICLSPLIMHMYANTHTRTQTHTHTNTNTHLLTRVVWVTLCELSEVGNWDVIFAGEAAISL